MRRYLDDGVKVVMGRVADNQFGIAAGGIDAADVHQPIARGPSGDFGRDVGALKGGAG